jgi:hypothetical protein
MAISGPDITRYGTGDGEAVGRRRVPGRRWLVAAAGLVLIAAVVVLWPLAATYQPVQFGGFYGGDPGSAGDFPGLPAGAGQPVNDFGAAQGDVYVAPRSAAFTIIEGITNSGPEAVTIEAVSIVAPGEQRLFPWPLTNAGRVEWALEEQSNPPLPRSVAACSYSAPCRVSDLSLAPQESIALAIPVRLVDSCYENNGWTGSGSFYVEERFGPFTHWVQVQDGVPYIFKEPEPAGTGPDTVCLAR